MYRTLLTFEPAAPEPDAPRRAFFHWLPLFAFPGPRTLMREAAFEPPLDLVFNRVVELFRETALREPARAPAAAFLCIPAGLACNPAAAAAVTASSNKASNSVRRIWECADNRELLQCSPIRPQARVPCRMRIRLITGRTHQRFVCRRLFALPITLYRSALRTAPNQPATSPSEPIPRQA